MSYQLKVRNTVKKSKKLSEFTKDVLVCGLCAFELGCVALEQGVLMEQHGLAVWVRLAYLYSYFLFLLQATYFVILLSQMTQSCSDL